MKKLIFLLALALASAASAQQPSAGEAARWERQARGITIARDDWGIAHVSGRTDADAVFGMIYAQAEDDFYRVERNYLNSLGRLAEAEGEAEVYRDLRMKLFIDPDTLRALYGRSPRWLKTLMDAWADGLNYYLRTHPQVKPRVIARFEPWMALSFTEGSIGGDIERIDLRALEAFYGGQASAGPGGEADGASGDAGAAPRDAAAASGDADGALGEADGASGEADATPRDAEAAFAEPGGSNGIAIAPSNTVNRRALFLINPHTTFFFRSELQMTSREGLNAYGAVTWGQFFVYQGFNERAGWMHTSSAVDNIDEYLETVEKKGDRFVYRYGGEERPVRAWRLAVQYRTATGMARKEFTVYRTHHGPIVREQDGRWVSVRLMHEPTKALTQSYTRTKARNVQEFRKTMDLHTNSSNNTIFADGEGNIAYFHANFVPRRDPRFDWTKPVDGSDPATEWGPVLSVDESPLVVNPSVGWVYNANDWPWSAAGPDSPQKEDFPAYVDEGGPSARGMHAVRVLEGRKDFTLESLRAAAYDSYLVAFDDLLPRLFYAYEALPSRDPLKEKLAEQVALLRAWDRRWSVSSVPTSLAVYWGTALGARPSSASPAELLKALDEASGKLASEFGSWKTPWGEINRFQRLTGAIDQPFDDTKPSLAVGFTSARWGSLASFGARQYPSTKRWYGTSGNSFVAVVEFGDSVRAVAVSAGGESGDPASPHFKDQAERYGTGDLREVYFYPSQLKGHTERTYRPGG